MADHRDRPFQYGIYQRGTDYQVHKVNDFDMALNALERGFRVRRRRVTYGEWMDLFPDSLDDATEDMATPDPNRVAPQGERHG